MGFAADDEPNSEIAVGDVVPLTCKPAVMDEGKTEDVQHCASEFAALDERRSRADGSRMQNKGGEKGR
jgi:hypothetical protein